jgi:Aspartyl/Asparaginyl beta-hydroxylase
MSDSWKGRYELPVIRRLDIGFDIGRLKAELKEFASDKVWDGLGSDYASLCETHTKLPKMFFKDEELEGISHVCELDWEHTSYQQLSLTEYDESFSLDQRVEKSGSAWDNRIAKGKTEADERWFRKVKQDVPPYLREVLAAFPGSHRARFANLAPHSEVKPHIDYDTLYGVRLHIAFDTNEDCFNGGWDKDGNEVKYHIPADGSVWFVNPGVKHYAINGGDTPRNHLIISIDSQEPIEHLY